MGRCKDRTNPLWYLIRRRLLLAVWRTGSQMYPMNVLRRRSNFRPIRRLSGSDSHPPPIIYMGLSCRECPSAYNPHRHNEWQHIVPAY